MAVSPYSDKFKMLLYRSERVNACLLTSFFIKQGDNWGTDSDHTVPKAPLPLHDTGVLPLMVY